jgi:hypothetical protein
MPISFNANSLLTQFTWESANFASGGGTTSHAWNVTGLDVTESIRLANVIRQSWVDNLRALTDSDLTLVSVRWEIALSSGEVSVNLPGSLSLTGTPPNTAFLASYATSYKGPRGRGRNYWPGLLPEAAVDERGVINPTNVTNFGTALFNFFDDIEADPSGIRQAIAQSDESGQVTSPIVPWPVVTNRIVQPIAATQRRRMRR